MKLLQFEEIFFCEPIQLYLVNFVGKGILYPNCWGGDSFSILSINKNEVCSVHSLSRGQLFATPWTLKSLLQYHSSKASILQHSAFFIVQLSHPYMITGKTIALTRRTFVGKVMSLLLNMLSRLVINFLPRSKRLLISWLQSPSAVILEPKNIKVCKLEVVKQENARVLAFSEHI